MSNQEHDPATVGGLLAYLAPTPFAASAASPLSGGNTNFVYRISLKAPYQGKSSLVVKHSRPYLGHSAQDSIFAGSRQAFEVGALRRVGRLLPPDATMTVPAVHHFDEEAHVIIMDDAGDGSKTLKQLILDRALDTSVLQEIGRATGIFLSWLHTSFGFQDQEALQWASGNKLAREISAWAPYSWLVGTVDGSRRVPALCDPPLQVSPDALATLVDVARLRTDEIMTSDEAFTMGDFWPGNFLVRLDAAQKLERVLVVDWEICKAGRAGFDVGQFCGDLRVLLQAHPELLPFVQPLVDAFIAEYARGRGDQDQAWISVAAVHFGVHMATWGPLIPYSTATRESTRALVEEGVRCIEEGHNDGAWTAGRLATLLSRGVPGYS